MAYRQVALHMLRNPTKFYKYIEQELLATGESYESYCVNIFDGNVWGDDLIAAAFGDMWNLSISIISPISKTPINLFHANPNPEIVIVANGGAWTSPDKASTHFSGTRSKDPQHRLPGSEHVNPDIAIDATPKLDPIIFIDKAKAKQLAIREYMKDSAENNLELLRICAKGINRLNKKIGDMIEVCDEALEEKKTLEIKLGHIGVSIERIKEAGLIDERCFVRTEQREKEDKEKAEKRKRDDEERERAAKKPKMIIKGEEAEEIIIPDDDDEDEKTKAEKHSEKRAKQQSEIIRAQEALLLKQEKHIAEQEARMRKIEEKQKEKVKEEEEGGDVPEDLTAEYVEPKVFPATASTSGTSSLAATLLKPEALRLLQQLNQPTREIIPEEQTPTIIAPKPTPVVYTPLIQAETQNLMLVKSQSHQSTSLRSGKRAPVKKTLRDPKRYYCEDCSANYSRIDQLSHHRRFNCLRELPEFMCDMCQRGFFNENSVREHYYQEHLNKPLYRCVKCNEPFFFKSRRTTHYKGACPNKDGEAKFPSRIELDPALEPGFKRRTHMAINLPPAVQQAAEEEMTDLPSETFSAQPVPPGSEVSGSQNVPVVTEPGSQTGMERETEDATGLLQELSEGGTVSQEVEEVTEIDLDP